MGAINASCPDSWISALKIIAHEEKITFSAKLQKMIEKELKSKKRLPK